MPFLSPIGESFGMHDAIGCLLDLDALTVSFSKNGADLGVAFRLPGRMRDATMFPAVVLKVGGFEARWIE